MIVFIGLKKEEVLINCFKYRINGHTADPIKANFPQPNSFSDQEEFNENEH